MEKKTSYIAIIGGIGAAILASLCCVLPFFLLLAGITGAWVGSLRIFEPYRPIFMVATGIFFGIGYYKLYIRPSKACADGTCNIPSPTRRMKVLFWTGLGVAIGLFIMPYVIGYLYG